MLVEVLNIPLQQEAQIPAITFSDRTDVTDEMLVRAVLSGDEQAFAEIFDRYRRPLTRVVSRFFRDRSEIEEFVQQAFTKAYFSLDKFRGGRGDSFSAWMTRIAINVCYDEFRKRGRRGETTFSEFGDDGNTFTDAVADQCGTSVEMSVATSDLADRMLSMLEPRDRVAMTLVYSEEHSLAEVADILGITASNLKSRLFRCRTFLKERFADLR